MFQGDLVKVLRCIVQGVEVQFVGWKLESESATSITYEVMVDPQSFGLAQLKVI